MGVEQYNVEDFVVKPSLARESELLDRVSEQLDDHSLSESELISALSGASAKRRIMYSTKSLHGTYWAHFTAWCDENDLEPLPAELSTILRYVRAHWFPKEGEVQPTLVHTQYIRVYAIKLMHEQQGVPYLHNSLSASEFLGSVLVAVRKVCATGRAVPRTSSILQEKHVRRVIRALPKDCPASVRDRAVLLSGYFGGMDESDLATLDYSDVKPIAGSDDLRLILRKDDGIHYAVRELKAFLWSDMSPVAAMTKWIEIRGTTPGPLFVTETETMTRLDASAIWEILADALRRIGFDPSRYSSGSLKHSLALERLGHGPMTREIMTHGNLGYTPHEPLHLIQLDDPDRGGVSCQ
ncbi:hypothetical protein B2J88_01770 [Rhodococcus sp. SRB_17]|nr:hypothetical protein [Rhodococcus sp. SRB_17]